MSASLLATKLYAPILRANLIRRPELTAKVRADGLRPLTLIAAPAGFGKTTLVAEWLHELQAHAHSAIASPPLQIAWLSLDDDDNDLGRFFAYFLAALRTITTPDLGENVLTLLQSLQPPPLRSILHTLAHTLINNLPTCVLVLDDYHVIHSQPIHETVFFLLEHVPNLHWIITTRADPPLPLARLRARQQLLEVRATDLRFRTEETNQLLNEKLQLSLTMDSLQALQSKTEGWIAGLQLAGLALQTSQDRAAFAQEFFGSHRFVADYLADEVLNHLTDETQYFLFQTAILGRLCADLCDAVMGDGRDAQSQQRLEGLEQANLFLVPLDDERRWYRYHHLFADLLRQRLQRRHPQLVSELHRRAAHWFAANDMIEDALHHAFAAQDFTQAADWLEQHNEALWMQGRFATLHQWLAALPTVILEQRLPLLLAQVWTHVLTDAPAATINTLIQQTETVIAQTNHPIQAHPGILAAIRAVNYTKQEDAANVIPFAQQALIDLPTSIGVWRSIALMALGFGYAMSGAVQSAQQTLAETIELCQQIGNRYSALVATMSLARTQWVQGQLRQAFTTYTGGLAQAAQQNLLQVPVVAQAHLNLGRLHYEWNQLMLATQQLQHGLAHLQGQGGSWVEFEGYTLLARAKQAQGQLTDAQTALDQAEQIARLLPFPWTKLATATTLVRIRLALGDATGAAAWLAQAQPTPLDELTRVREAEHFTAVCVLIAQANVTEALALLAHITEVAEAAGRMKAVVESGVLTAVAHHRQGNHQAARATLRKTLILAETEGYIRTLIDEGEPIRSLLLELYTEGDESPRQIYLARLLKAFDDEQTSPAQLERHEPIHHANLQQQNLLEPLSTRELELLRLMADGLSNQEIADRLIITVGTVKSHANHIFAKLGVQGRVKAINRARELGLL